MYPPICHNNFLKSRGCAWDWNPGPQYLCSRRRNRGPIDTVSNLVFWSRFLNKLAPWHIVYIMQQ